MARWERRERGGERIIRDKSIKCRVFHGSGEQCHMEGSKFMKVGGM